MTDIKVYFTNTKRILIEHFNNKIIAAYITPKTRIKNVDIITNVWQLVKAEKQKEQNMYYAAIIDNKTHDVITTIKLKTKQELNRFLYVYNTPLTDTEIQKTTALKTTKKTYDKTHKQLSKGKKK